MKKKILICGAGGFIGGHLAARFVKEKKYDLVCADIKPKEYWFQIFDEAQNYSCDLKEYENTNKVTKDVDYRKVENEMKEKTKYNKPTYFWAVK